MEDASTTAARCVARVWQRIPARPSFEPRRATTAAVLVAGSLVATAAACSPSQPAPMSPPLAVTPEAGVDGGPDVAPVDAPSESSEVIQLCEAINCVDTVGLAITLPVPSQNLATAKVTVVLGAERLELPRPRAIDRKSTIGFLWKPPKFIAEQRVLSLSASSSQLQLGIGVPPELMVDGLNCSVRVESDTGTVLLDVSRAMRPAEMSSTPTSCKLPCRHIAMRLYDKSKPGLTCDSNACEAGLELRLIAPGVMSEIDGGFVEVCRQQQCSRAKLEGLWVVQKVGVTSRYFFDPPLSGWVDYDSKSPDELVFEISAEPEALRDGDRYSLKFVKSSKVLGEVHHTVQYRSWYPNGQDCDTVPCRRATVQSRL